MGMMFHYFKLVNKETNLTLEGVSVSSMLSPSNTKRIAPCESPCLSQYAVISFLSGVFFLILKCTTLPSYEVRITYNKHMHVYNTNIPDPLLSD